MIEDLLKHYDVLLAYCYKITQNREQAKDLCQETMMRAFMNIYKYEDREYKLSTWLYSIAKNHYIDQMRTSNKVEKLKKKLDWNSGSQKLPDSDMICTEIMNGVSKLKNGYQKVIMMRIQGLSYDEISKELGKHSGTVRRDIHIARRKLKLILDGFIPTIN